MGVVRADAALVGWLVWYELMQRWWGGWCGTSCCSVGGVVGVVRAVAALVGWCVGGRNVLIVNEVLTQ